MKWKCKNCVWGPCVFESPRNDDYLVNIEKCMQESRQANWQKMSAEEPEQEAETILPKWLKVGNFVWMDATNAILFRSHDVAKGIFKIEDIRNGNNFYLKKRGDKDFTVFRTSSRITIDKLNMQIQLKLKVEILIFVSF